jgi:hypothetical protein
MRVIENRALRRTFEPKRDDALFVLFAKYD